ncbi:MAG: PqqD family protein [Bacteroidales bacterium]|nr:PqqD family protein [Bacteroidales bacterium]
MRILDGLVLRPLGREFIVTGDGLSRIDFSKVVSMNATAAYLWKELQGRDFTVEEMVGLLTARYDVSEQAARADAVKLLDSWSKAGLLAE